MQNILLDFLMWLITTLSNIFVKPIMTLVTKFIPNIATYISSTQIFFTTYVFDTMRFLIRFLLNVVRIPQSALVFGFTYLTLKVALYLGMIVVKFIIKIWGIVKP